MKLFGGKNDNEVALPKFDDADGPAELTPEGLERTLRRWVRLRQPGIVVGPPGVGKTFTAKRVGEWAEAEKLIKTWEIVTGSKDLAPDYLFESRLVIRKSSEGNVKLLPSLVRKHCRRTRRDLRDTAEGALASWNDDDWLLIFLDEATRCTAAFLDSLLPCLNDFQVQVEGRACYAPVLIVLLANPAGMDATTSAFSHALTSRLFERVTMYQPGPDEMARTYTFESVRKDAQRYGIAPPTKETEELIREACAAITLMWGLPLERRGIASLSDDAKRLLAAVRDHDPVLADWMHALGTLTHFGPDPRRGRRWTCNAMVLAHEQGLPLSRDHFVATSVGSLVAAGKDTFSEGQEPEKQLLKGQLIHAIARRFFGSESLRRLALSPAMRGRRFHDDDPQNLARVVGPELFPALKTEAIEWYLTNFQRQLAAEGVSDREASYRLASEFLRRAARLVPGADADAMRANIVKLAKLPDSRVVADDGGFVSRAVRDLLRTLTDHDAATPGAAALRTLLDDGDRPRPLEVDEEVRLAVAAPPHDRWAPLAASMAAVVRTHPAMRGRFHSAVALLTDLSDLPPTADARALKNELIGTHFAAWAVDNAAPLNAFLNDLFAAVSAGSRQPYRDRFAGLVTDGTPG